MNEYVKDEIIAILLFKYLLILLADTKFSTTTKQVPDRII